MITNVYVDGFNLYHRALKGTRYKWLNLEALCHALLPSYQINRIRYFTALIDERPGDPQQQQRQLTYLRALQTIPSLSVHRGQFRTDPRRRPLAHPIPGVSRTVEVLETREKGSDVNLATFLLMDGYKNDYEQAVVISNDSDLALPIKMVRDELGFPVGVVNPSASNKVPTTKELQDAATFMKRIWTKTLKGCLFPDALVDKNGTITKPVEWDAN